MSDATYQDTPDQTQAQPQPGSKPAATKPSVTTAQPWQPPPFQPAPPPPPGLPQLSGSEPNYDPNDPSQQQQQQPQQQQPQQYIGSPPVNTPSQWGQPDMHLQRAANFPGVDPSPFMPQVRDIPNMVHQIGGFFGRFGSYNVGRSSIGMMNNWSAYVNGYVRGQMLRAELAKGQFQEQMEQTVLNQRTELLHYAEIADTYNKNPEQARQAMRILAQQNHDPYLIAALDQGYDQGLAVLNTKNQWLQSLMKTSSQSKKANENQEMLQAWGLPGGQQQQGGGFGSEFQPRPQTAPAAPGAPARPGQVAAGGGQAGGGEQVSSGNVGQTAIPAPDETPAQTAARTMFHGAYLPAKIEEIVGPDAMRLQASASQWLNQCQGEQCLTGLEKIDPDSARTVRNLLNNSEGIAQIEGQGNAKASQYAELLRQYALKVSNGQWKPEIYNNLKKFTDTSSAEFKQITATRRLAEAGALVLDSARDVGIDTLPPANIMRQWIAGNVTDDPKWKRLFNNWRMYATMVSQLALGGVARTTYIKQLTDNLSTKGPRALLAAMQGDANDAIANVSTYVDLWQQNRPSQPVPGLGGDTIPILNALASHLDYNTAKFYDLKNVPYRLTRGHAGTTLPETAATGIPQPGAGTARTQTIGGKTYYRHADGTWWDTP